MSVLLDKLRGFFTTNTNWNLLARKKAAFAPSVKTEEDPNETWEIVGDIGDGAFGKIFKALNKESGLYSALKQVNVDDEADLTQYSVEVTILSELKHTNIVGMHEAFYYDSKFWMYLEYCEVGAVDNIIHELEHGLSEPQIQSISKQMCTGLKFLHDNGVIHRDLKAGNVLVTTEAVIKLADFGVSAKGSGPEQKRSTFIGTPYWMAPEVIACETVKDDPYDLRADIWSFGITLIEFAQMDPPYSKMNPGRVCIKIMRSDPPTFDKPKKWSSDLNDFLAKCLQKEPSSRFLASQLLEHPFLRDVESNLPLVQLIKEAKADVMIEVCDVDSQDNLSSSLSNSNSSEDLLADAVPPSRSPTSEKATTPSSDKVLVVDVHIEEPSLRDNGRNDVKLNGHNEPRDTSEPDERSQSSKVIEVSGVEVEKHVTNGRKVVDEEEQELSLAIADETDEDISPLQQRPGDVSGWPTNGFHQGKFGTKPSQRLLLQTGAVAAYSERNNAVVMQSPEGASTEGNFDREDGRYRSLTKTRSYYYEGKMITQKTSKLVVSGDENRQQEEHQTRKANMRALKLLQFNENRHLELMNQRFIIQKENLEKQFEQDLRDSLKSYSADCEQLAKDQKQEIEKLEGRQVLEHRTLSKTIREQQEKELRAFQDSLKRELRIAKRESSGVPKNIQRRQLEQKEVEFAEAERTYREHHSEMMKKALDRLTTKHRNEMAGLESKLLEEKHNLLRVYEGQLWTLEEKRLSQKTELLQLQINEAFERHKEQAIFRHAQEMEHAKRSHDRDLVKLKQKLTADGKEAAKQQKTQLRLETQRLKEKFRATTMTSEQEKEKLKEIEEKLKGRIREENQKQDAKNKLALETFEHEHATYISELKQLNDDRMSELEQRLVDKLHEENGRYRAELTDWQFNLSSRKRTLEEEFSWQLAEQRRFYSQVNHSSASYPALLPSPVQETTSSWMNSDNHISTAL